MTVLVVTHRDDEYVPDLVTAAVHARGHECVRVDSDEYPRSLSLSVASSGRALLTRDTAADDDGIEIDLARASAVWLRRVWPARAPLDVDARYADACMRQSTEALEGALLWLEDRGAVVVNALAAQKRAENKIAQLNALEARAGPLRLPPTLVTNDADAARAFLVEHAGHAVVKTLAPLSDSPREFVYTSAVDDADAADIASIAVAPVILQRRIDKVRDVRVVVVGERVLAASLEGTALDWRVEKRARWRAVDAMAGQASAGKASAAQASADRLDGPVAAACVAIVKRLGLAFGVVDLVVDADGAHWFLEVNPAGEWGFLQRDCGLDVAGALADLLTKARA